MALCDCHSRVPCPDEGKRETVATLALITDEQEDEADLATHGLVSVMDYTGDTKYQWDRKNAQEVATAKQMFASFRRDGYLAFAVDKRGEQGEQMHDFDPDAGKILFVPPMKGG